MIQVAKFSDRFFKELVKSLSIYGVLYVMEDGNIYRTESQAKDRAASREKLAHLNQEEVLELRYAKVTMDNLPTTAAELEDMFEAQFRERRKVAKEEERKAAEQAAPQMTDAEAEAILRKKRANAAPDSEEESAPVKEPKKGGKKK